MRPQESVRWAANSPADEIVVLFIPIRNLLILSCCGARLREHSRYRHNTVCSVKTMSQTHAGAEEVLTKADRQCLVPKLANLSNPKIM